MRKQRDLHTALIPYEEDPKRGKERPGIYIGRAPDRPDGIERHIVIPGYERSRKGPFLPFLRLLPSYPVQMGSDGEKPESFDKPTHFYQHRTTYVPNGELYRCWGAVAVHTYNKSVLPAVRGWIQSERQRLGL